MKFLLLATALLVSAPSMAAVIEAKTPVHQLAMRPVAQMKNGQCQITGAVVVNGELVNGADIGLRAEASPALIARTKTNAKGVYSLSVRVPKGARLQEIVVSNPTADGKVAVFPGQVIACN